MSKIQKMVTKLDTEMNKVYEEYIQLHRDLDKHRGKEIGDTNLPEVNRLLKEIQEKFAELYHVYYFIAFRHQYAANAVNDYNNFVEILQKAGAQRDEPESKSKIIIN